MTDTIADGLKACHHTMHLPSGKCLGCGEQHQPLPDYQPGDDEKYLAEDNTPNASVPAELVERVARALWNHTKLVGCSKGFHEGASDPFESASAAEQEEILGYARATIAAAMPPAGRVEK